MASHRSGPTAWAAQIEHSGSGADDRPTIRLPPRSAGSSLAAYGHQ